MPIGVFFSFTTARTLRPCARSAATVRCPTSLIASTTRVKAPLIDDSTRGVEGSGIFDPVKGTETSVWVVGVVLVVGDGAEGRRVLTALNGNSTAERIICAGVGGGLK